MAAAGAAARTVAGRWCAGLAAPAAAAVHLGCCGSSNKAAHCTRNDGKGQVRGGPTAAQAGRAVCRRGSPHKVTRGMRKQRRQQLLQGKRSMHQQQQQRSSSSQVKGDSRRRSRAPCLPPSSGCTQATQGAGKREVAALSTWPRLRACPMARRPAALHRPGSRHPTRAASAAHHVCQAGCLPPPRPSLCSPRLLVVHDALGGGQDDVAELAGGQQAAHPRLNVLGRNVIAGGDRAALVQTAAAGQRGTGVGGWARASARAAVLLRLLLLLPLLLM